MVEWIQDNIEKLPQGYFESLYEKALKPRDFKLFKLSLRCLGFKSIDHFMLLIGKDIQTIQMNPSDFWKGHYAEYLQGQLERHKQSFNLFGLSKFAYGQRLFKRHFDDIQFQYFAYLRNGNSEAFKLAAGTMILWEERTSAFTGDRTVLQRIQVYDKDLRASEIHEIELRNDMILSKWKPHIFVVKCSDIQVRFLIKQLISSEFKFIDPSDKATLLLILGGRKQEKISISYGITWNRSGAELVYFFFLLLRHKLLSNMAEADLLDYLTKTFKNRDGEWFKYKSLKKAGERGGFGRFDLEDLYQYSNDTIVSYKNLYEIVLIVGEME